jgi:Tol biopolymer transport system component
MGGKRRSNFKTNRSKEREPVVTQEATTQKMEARSKRRSVLLLALALGALLATSVAMTGTVREAHAAQSEKIVFASNRTSGTGVNNPTGDTEIFRMNPDGTNVKQLTFNEVNDIFPTLSPDGAKVAYVSSGKQTSNPEGDYDIYVMNASDGTAKKNLSNNGSGVNDVYPVFSPGGKRIAYESSGQQTSNLEGDHEVYRMSALDGSVQKNLTNNAATDGIYAIRTRR